MMPHVIVKLYPGRSEQQKTQLAEAIVKDVVAIARCEEKSVSVAFAIGSAAGTFR
jgi:4-oxalocrotonate tautomerase